MCAIVDARFLKPFDAELARKLSDRPMVTIEDGAACGGLFSALAEATAALPGARILSATWPDRVLPHGNVADLRRICGLTPAGICDGMELAFGKTVV